MGAMDDFGLDSFLTDIAARDDFLKKAPPMPREDYLPPVRGEEAAPAPPKKKQPPKAQAAPPAAPPPAKPKDDGAIWDDAEVPALTAERPASAPSGSTRKVTIEEDAHYFEFEDCHNLFITTETGTAS